MREFARVMRGYSRQQVDDLFTRIDGGQITPEELRQVDFEKQMLGYEPGAVDAALAEIRQNLAK